MPAGKIYFIPYGSKGNSGRYEVQAELPAAVSTKDIDVPSEGAKALASKKDGKIIP